MVQVKIDTEFTKRHNRYVLALLAPNGHELVHWNLPADGEGLGDRLLKEIYEEIIRNERNG